MKTVYTSPPRRLPTPPAPCVTPVPHHDKTVHGAASQSCMLSFLPDTLAAALLHAAPPGGQIEEIRLRAGRRAALTVAGCHYPTPVIMSGEEMATLLVRLCEGSLYAYSDTINQGYITLSDGVRIGVGGTAVCEEGRIIGVRDVTSLCIRLPHRRLAVGGTVCRLLRRMAREGEATKGVLLYAPPGVGKTTCLRAVAATMAAGPDPWHTVLIDTRGELSFGTEGCELSLDVLTGYPRARGVEIATRTLAARLIICDEIGDVEEAMALISAHHGGVPLVASAHAGTVEELLRRTGIRLLHEARLFGAYVGLRRSHTPTLDGESADYLYHVTSWEEAERCVCLV